jgi:hypothetical protein
MSVKVPYTNLPPQTNNNSTLQAIANYYTNPIQLNAGQLDAITAFFTSKGFDPISAQSIAVVIIAQAKNDNLNPLQILDTMKNLDGVQINALVAEIVNYTRYKTSFLGYGQAITSNAEVSRNVLP